MSADSFGFDRNDATSSPTIKVEIYDQAYTVRSDGDPEYLKQLAEYVDQRMRDPIIAASSICGSLCQEPDLDGANSDGHAVLQRNSRTKAVASNCSHRRPPAA